MSEFDYQFILEAKNFCEKAHEGQTRWNGDPFSIHPKQVVAILQDFGFHEPTLLAAAYLHDVLEDTSTSEEDIRRHFGHQVLRLVRELTHKAKTDEEYLAYVRNMSYYAKVIKMGDIISNLSGEDKKSPHFVDKRIRALQIILKEVLSRR